MRLRRSVITILSCAALLVAGTVTFGQVRAYRVSDDRVENVLVQIESGTDRFRRAFDLAIDQSRFDGTSREDALQRNIEQFENATDRLRQRFEAEESVSADVTRVLNSAAYINKFMTGNALGTMAERHWVNIRNDLNTLAGYYSLRYDWNAAVIDGDPIDAKPYRVTDRQVDVILRRIENRTDNFKGRLDTALDRSVLDNTNREDRINQFVAGFEADTDRLRERFDAGASVDNDVERVLSSAAYIDAFVRSNKLTNVAERNWQNIKNDLNTLAGYYNVTFSWTAPTQDYRDVAYTVRDNTVDGLLSSIETKTDTYRRLMEQALDRSILNNTYSERSFLDYIDEFENATDRLDQRFDARESTDQDVTNVLARAAYIESFMRDYRLMRSAEYQWRSLKTDLNTLAQYYAVDFAWNRPYPQAGEFNSMITGTYRLNRTLSDDVPTVVRNAIDVYPQIRLDRIERNLTRRLSSPMMLAIDKSGTKVMIASSNAPQVSFTADGITRTETNNGRQIQVTANSYYEGVSLAYDGAGANEFYVNFMPVGRDQLRVIRRVNLENPDETITVASVYDKVESTADWNNVYDPRRNGNPDTGTTGSFIVPAGTDLRAVLNSTISTSDSEDGERFTMRVTSPNRYEGAIITGHVVEAERSGLFTGRAKMTLDFDTIRLRNGRTYEFAGLIEGVTLANGKQVTIDNEGEVRDEDSQTRETVTRAGIGAGVGAIIGAILGGGEGAAIGAAVGGAAGAGTVVAQGRENVVLDPGSTILIEAQAPAYVGSNR
ncbi:MAG: hypothetical protein IPM63_16745 [Acidobacteriota bacterium]|nr:MAG: hypothetical protein IPM63_16745 [Acidobacteriota bacterium]